ncbi:MAG: S49 family peptidase, partial [Rhodospirillales bacterium]|nr:S49 family peptidase [Rhodospirillales bacterium]
MSLDPDYVVERRQLKRRLTFWRVAGIIAIVAAVVAAAGRFDFITHRDHVARIAIDGLILDDKARDEALAEVAGDKKTRALLVKIDSPGGTYVGGEALYQTLRRVAAKKPVVAVMGTTATSAGYMTALASDHILARASSLTGSIGVIMQTMEYSAVLERFQIKVRTIKSGKHKDMMSPTREMTEEDRQ